MPQVEWVNLASLLSLAVGILSAALFLAGVFPTRAVAVLTKAFRNCADTPVLCWIFLPTLSIALNLIITVHKGLPQPLIHDEFSYLLAADTFAHGRLTNPTPPFSDHFETPQQLMKPTYMSKYPPGQGIALAVGQVLFKKPLMGAWLSTAAAVLAIYWMLLGFVPPSWALLGGIVAAAHPQLLDWSQKYWGGSVAVLGGALVLGSWGRLMNSASARTSIILAVGLIVLANSRPFEGCVLAAPLVVALLIQHGSKCRRIVLPASTALLPAAVAMCYYNYRITGRPFQIPYLEYAAQYEIYPKFWFLPPRPSPVYRNAAMEFVHRYFERGAYNGFHTLGGAFDHSKYQFGLLFTVNVSLAVLLLPLMVTLFTRKDRRLTWVIISAGGLAIALWTEIFVFPHYLAPLVPAVILIVIVGWQKMSSWKWHGRDIGTAITRATFVGFLAGAAMALAQPVYHDPDMLDQKSVIAKLPSLHDGRHLIFVSYAPMHSYHVELVHNLSDLNDSRIIWARKFDPETDQPLANLYPDRHIWWLYVGGKLELSPYLDR